MITAVIVHTARPARTIRVKAARAVKNVNLSAIVIAVVQVARGDNMAYTDSNLSVVPVKAVHVSELVTALNTLISNAKLNISVGTMTYAKISATNVKNLQNAVHSLEGSFSGNCCQANCCQTCQTSTCQTCQVCQTYSCQSSNCSSDCGCIGGEGNGHCSI